MPLLLVSVGGSASLTTSIPLRASPSCFITSGVMTPPGTTMSWFSGVRPSCVQRVDHDDRVDRKHADGVVVLLGDLRRDRCEVGGVLRVVDRVDFDVRAVAASLTSRFPANSTSACRAAQRRRFLAAGFDRGRGRDAKRETVHRRIGVLVRQFERRRAVHEDCRATSTPSRRRRSCRSTRGSRATRRIRALRPHATLALRSVLSSQIVTCSGRPSAQVRFTPSTAALTPVCSTCPALPNGDERGDLRELDRRAGARLRRRGRPRCRPTRALRAAAARSARQRRPRSTHAVRACSPRIRRFMNASRRIVWSRRSIQVRSRGGTRPGSRRGGRRNRRHCLRATIAPRVMTSARSATDKALWMCCSTSSTAVPASAAARTARSKRSTMSGARPSDSSSTRRSRHCARETPSEREHLLLAARQEPDAAVEVRFELREQLHRAVNVAATDAQVLACGEVHQHGPLLRHDTESLASTNVQRRVGARAEEAHVAAEGAQLTRQRRDRRRLARAVRPEQCDHLALVDTQVEIAHDLDVAVTGA